MAFSAGQVLTAAQLNDFNTYSLEVEPDPAGPAATPAPITFTTHTPASTGAIKYDSSGYFDMELDGTLRYRFGNASQAVDGQYGFRGFSCYTTGAMEIHRDTTGILGDATFDQTGGGSDHLWTSVGHGLVNDDAIAFYEGSTNPTEFTASAPISTIYYVGDATTDTFRLYTDTAANSGTLVTGSADSDGTWRWTDAQEIAIANFRASTGQGTFQHRLFAGGYTGNRMNVYAGFSDERVKENIVPYGDPRQDLMDMEVINYNLTGDIEKGEVVPYDRPDPIKQVGYSAQALLSIKPGLVFGNEYSGYSVKYSVLTPILHRAWQLDHADLEALEARVAALESA